MTFENTNFVPPTQYFISIPSECLQHIKKIKI